jgi:hypothetical protein
MAQQPLVGQSLLTITVSQSHLDTPRSAGLFWACDQLYEQHTTLTKETCIHVAGFEPAVSASQRPQTYALNTQPLGYGPR